ncbi:hypothetical protein [Fulvivirga sp.]|uniref:hypothetical protein n=1 Tax=Fulvivirga sp. TaxID=1931237 RepID=UPI0032EAD15A
MVLKKSEHVLFETNFHSKETLNHIIEAKKFNFKTELVFIGLESEELAIKRVAQRVSENGHYVNNRTFAPGTI